MVLNPAANNKFIHVIKSVIDTKNLGLKIEHTENSNKPWENVSAIVTMWKTL